jgi:hypothetical protein
MHPPRTTSPMQRALDALVADLVSEFTRYLDFACGGELRHASTWSCELPTCPVIGRGTDRSVVARLARVGNPSLSGWVCSAGFRGSLMAEPQLRRRTVGVDRLNAPCVPEKVTSELFLDRVWNLQHHGGIVLVRRITVR